MYRLYEVKAAKNTVFMMLRRVALLRTDVSEKRIATIMRVTKVGEPET
jgi:hypothetical protein